MTSSIRLLPPADAAPMAGGSAGQGRRVPVLDPQQRRVVERAPGSGPVAVFGAPGTGKSTVLVETAVRRITHHGLDPANVLILAPSRAAAARLRDALTRRLDRSLSTAPARTWSSYAFDLIRRARVQGRLPGIKAAPRLLSGAEQDLIIRELLAGHGSEGIPALPWPDSLALALRTRGFRQEIRELFDRVSEYGLDAEELATLGRRHGRQDWVAAADLYREYRDVVDLRMPEAFDPAGILTAARDLLENDPELLAGERRCMRLVLVDDYQEANTAVHGLLGMIGKGADAVVTASPDTAVQGFRGARPELAGRLADVLTHDGGLPVETLGTSHRMPGPVAQAWQNIASRIPVAGGAPGSRRLAYGPGNGASATVHVVDSDFHELRYVAQRILEAQLLQGRSPEDIAVVVRSGPQLSRLQRYLTGQGIAVNIPAAETPVRDEPAVRPLLDLFAVVLGQRRLDPDLAVALLTSRIGGASPLELRRLRQALRREELSTGSGRPSDELLLEALEDPQLLAELKGDTRPARRIAAMLAAGRAALAERAANPETVLWAIWSTSGWSGRWADAALSEGAAAARADRDLDAVVALFQTAERFVDQVPGATPASFLDYLLSQELPMDTLAPRARNRGSVALLTPAAAAGRQWPVVIVPGLQEDVWPNLRLRGELLGAGELAAAVEHGDGFRSHRDPQSLIQEIRADELRSFSAAVSRASGELICCAVASDDAQPSQFLDLVEPLGADVLVRVATPVKRPLTLRALVAELRRYAQQPDAHPGLAAEAVAHLGLLAARRPDIPGAHPDSWWGLRGLSTEDPVVPPGQPVPVSPSRVEAVVASPLNWFVSAAGGEPATDFARSLGTLVHGIAQDLPEATGTEYLAELQRRWPSLGMKENWEGRMDFRRAEAMVRKLAAYVISMRRQGRTLLGTEVDFTVDLALSDDDGGRVARLRGQVDRLEIDAEGRLYIVDLKTGKSQPAPAEVPHHPQLAAYQVAAQANALADRPITPGAPVSGGAALVQLGTDRKDPAIQEQEPLSAADTWARSMIDNAARLMSAATFEAVHDPRRGDRTGCRLPEICPLCAEGKQVTE
jgi:superfamily I DNA/RNA helicase/RecB family exonuclease